MTVSIKHKFVNLHTDGPDATVVRPSNWNDDHDLTGLGTAAELDVDADTALAADSDTKIATQKAVKAYVDANSGSGIAALVDDTSPQLGGDLDLNGHVVTGLVIGTNVQAWDADLDTWATKTAPSGTVLGSDSLDTDGTLAGNSDSKVATQKAVKTYADQLIAAADVMVFKGVVDCSANPNYPAADAGWSYRVSVAGKIGGASGVNVEVGDLLLCLVDSTASGNQATVGANWSIAQTNIDGAVVGPSSATSGNIATYSGTTGKIIQDGGKALPSGTIVGTTDSQTLTNKALTSPAITTPTGIVKGDVGLGNVDNTSDATKNSATATLTNKTLDAASNTILNIGASGLASASVTFIKIASAAIATTAQWLSNTASLLLTTDQLWAAAAEVALTDAATIAVDMSTFINASVTLGGNRTLGNPTNTKNGQSGIIRFIQDGTGSRTLAFSSNWKFIGGQAPVLTTTAGHFDGLSYYVVSSTVIWAWLHRDVS